MDVVGGTSPSVVAFGAAFAAGLVTLGLLDFLWIGFIARDLYFSTLQPIMTAQPRIVAAALFYILYIAGLTYFVVTPAMEKHSLSTAALNGALMGALAYATYDLTNLATLTAFTWNLAIIDIAWGAFASALVCTAGTLAARAV